MLDGFAFTFKMYGTRFMSLTFFIVCVCFFYRFFFRYFCCSCWYYSVFCLYFRSVFFVYNGPYVDILLSDSYAMLVLICSFFVCIFLSLLHSFHTKDTYTFIYEDHIDSWVWLFWKYNFKLSESEKDDKAYLFISLSLLLIARKYII